MQARQIFFNISSPFDKAAKMATLSQTKLTVYETIAKRADLCVDCFKAQIQYRTRNLAKNVGAIPRLPEDLG
jgi:hypothetical protein